MAIIRWKIGEPRGYSWFFKAASANFKADDSVPYGIPWNTRSLSLATRSSWGGLWSRAPPRILGVEPLPGMFPVVCLQPRRAESTTSALQKDARLEAAPVELFPDKPDVTEQSACQKTVAQDIVPDDAIPNVDGEVDLMPAFADSIRNIPSPEVSVVDAEYSDM